MLADGDVILPVNRGLETEEPRDSLHGCSWLRLEICLVKHTEEARMEEVLPHSHLLVVETAVQHAVGKARPTCQPCFTAWECSVLQEALVVQILGVISLMRSQCELKWHS